MKHWLERVSPALRKHWPHIAAAVLLPGGSLIALAALALNHLHKEQEK
jgi:hypothetical protein